ncbi:hypothetical protein ABIB40_002809 [Pedobacter sp. UYP30]|uniref:hypothetical protein n=1 Tax=Pedobacter sp. UYP30 TaxID=1756400 RepID=UPI003393B280
MIDLGKLDKKYTLQDSGYLLVSGKFNLTTPMKRPFDTVKDFVFDNLDKTRENNRFIFEHTDKFMVWIVGFSIGGLSLIIINLNKFDKTFSHSFLKSILVLLVISIISGIVYRIAFYTYQVYYQQIEFYLEGAFSNKEFMEIEPDDLTEETDIKEVIRRLKEDFGEDVSNMFSIYEKSDEERKLFLLNDLKSHYKKLENGLKKILK